MKVLFVYDDISVDFSKYEDLDISCEIIKTGIEKGFITQKATDKRYVKITGNFDIELPKDQQGSLYIYNEEQKCSIWQATYIGCFFHHAPRLSEEIYEFSAIGM